MRLTYEYHAEAFEEFRDAILWYKYTANSRVADEFAQIVVRKIEEILLNPYLHPIETEPFRKCLIEKYPYKILYEISQEKIYIIAIHHQKRRPGYWASRIEE